MKKAVRRLTALLLTLAWLGLCPLAAAGAEEERLPERRFAYEGDFEAEGIGGVIEDYLERKELNGPDIAIGWRDLESGEEWYYNADRFIYGASTYKLPLAMVYTDRINAGEIAADKVYGSYPLEEDLHRMVANSDNFVARVLLDALGMDEDEMRVLLAQYSALEIESLPRGYYTGGFSPRFLIGTLQTLYDRSDEYSRILEYMKEARPDTFLSLYRGELEVAHKYGSIPGYLCDSGIVYAERPFLMTVLTHNIGSGMLVIGELGAIAMDYAAYLARLPEPTPEPTPQPTAQPTPAPTPQPTVEPAPEPESAEGKTPGSPTARIAAAAVLAVAVLAAGVAYRKRNL